MAIKAAEQNDDIQVLRAVAVTFSVLCHLVELRWKGVWTAWLPRVDYWGGVDLFFCISGFVITGSLLRQTRLLSFWDFARSFYIRRIFRIWPSALLWLCIPLLAAIFFNRSHVFGHVESVMRDATAAALQVANLYYSVCSGDCGKEAVYWSLSLEEQFYLIFPLLLFFMRHQYLRYLLVFLIVLQFPFHRPVESVLWYVRTDAICYGVLIAMAQQTRPLFLPAFGTLPDRRIAITLGCLLIIAIAAISISSTLWVNAGLLALTSACLVKLASFDADIILPWQRIRPLLLWLGSRSYAIYLVHEPCFWAVRELLYGTRFNPSAHPGGGATLAWTIAALVLVAAAGDATYRFFESPLRNLGRRLAVRHLARVSAPAIPA